VTTGEGGQSIPPQTTTRVVGTDLEVWHDGKGVREVYVLSDGAVDLVAGPNWIVKVARQGGPD
jgi:hypothetical protein